MKNKKQKDVCEKEREKGGKSGKVVATEELRQGGGIAHFTGGERRVGEEQKCVYPEEDFISTHRG